jgi:NAD+ diphosphatase
MVGYFCELDGDPDSIELDRTELRESLWLTREEIPENLNDYTMAYEMLLKFKAGLE